MHFSDILLCGWFEKSPYLSFKPFTPQSFYAYLNLAWYLFIYLFLHGTQPLDNISQCGRVWLLSDWQDFCSPFISLPCSRWSNQAAASLRVIDVQMATFKVSSNKIRAFSFWQTAAEPRDIISRLLGVCIYFFFLSSLFSAHFNKVSVCLSFRPSDSICSLLMALCVCVCGGEWMGCRRTWGPSGLSDCIWCVLPHIWMLKNNGSLIGCCVGLIWRPCERVFIFIPDEQSATTQPLLMYVFSLILEMSKILLRYMKTILFFLFDSL